MDLNYNSLPRYACHKKVGALEIANATYEPDPTANREVFFTNGNSAIMPVEMFSRYVPVPGDFLVVYEDGYMSFSPRKAFLDGYTLTDDRSFADIKGGLRIGRPPRSDLAAANIGDGVALRCAPHPSDEEKN